MFAQSCVWFNFVLKLFEFEYFFQELLFCKSGWRVAATPVWARETVVEKRLMLQRECILDEK